MTDEEIAEELARRNEANIARIEAMVEDERAAANRLDALAIDEPLELVAFALRSAAARMRSDARGNEKWLDDLRGYRTPQ